MADTTVGLHQAGRLDRAEDGDVEVDGGRRIGDDQVGLELDRDVGDVRGRGWWAWWCSSGSVDRSGRWGRAPPRSGGAGGRRTRAGGPRARRAAGGRRTGQSSSSLPLRRHRAVVIGPRRPGGTPPGPARAGPRWRGPCGRAGRPPAAPTGRRGSAGSGPPGGGGPGRRARRGHGGIELLDPVVGFGHGSGVTISWSPRCSRSARRQWSTSLLRATVISHPVVSRSPRPLRTASTAARNVSAVRSSASASVGQRRMR